MKKFVFFLMELSLPCCLLHPEVTDKIKYMFFSKYSLQMPAWISSGVKIQVLGDPAWKMNISNVIVNIIKLALKLYFQNHYYGVIFFVQYFFSSSLRFSNIQSQEKRRNKSKERKKLRRKKNVRRKKN